MTSISGATCPQRFCYRTVDGRTPRGNQFTGFSALTFWPGGFGFDSCSSDRQHLTYTRLWFSGGKWEISELLCTVLCKTVVHNGMHTDMSSSEIYVYSGLD